MKAIIMAGGQGSRLRPLTCDRPKPMVPVGNRPIMEYAVDLLKSHGIEEIGVTLQYLPQKIMDHFDDGSSFGVNMKYFIEEVPLGTAGSVKNAGDFLDETFVVISGDALTDFNLKEAIKFHKEKGAIATIVLTEVASPLEYGVVITEKDGRIKRFLEKPGWGEVFSDWVNTGIYILEPEVLDYFDHGIQYDFSKDLFPQLLKNNEPLFGCLLSGYWCDIGNLDQYVQAHLDILKGKAKVNPRGFLLTDSEDGITGPVLIGENCQIREGASVGPYTVIGDNVVLDAGSSIKKSVLWNNVYIGKSSNISGAIITKGVTVKPCVNIFEGAAIGDDSVINDRTVIKPNVKIWPDKIVDTGSVVKESLVWGSKHKKELFGTEGIPGLVNWDITPELGAKLGTAFGSILKEGNIISVSSDGQPVTKMLKNAIAAGLISTGVEVNDLGDVTTPIHRYAIRELNLHGGVHIKNDYQNTERCWVQFFDKEGVNIDRNKERKIESMFDTEEFRRVAAGKVGEILNLTGFIRNYLEYVLSGVDIESLRNREYKIIADINGPVPSRLMSILAERLNLNTEDFRRENKFLSFKERTKKVSNLAENVKRYSKDMGVMLDYNGERIILVDNKGRVINTHTFIALMVLVLLKIQKGRTVVVPITASEVVEKIAEKYGGKIVRSKTAPWAMMQATLKIEKEDPTDGYSQFFFQHDAIYALVKILDFLNKREMTLADLVDEIPEFYLKVETTPCPWDKKGRVMRALIEEEDGEFVELIDGVKIRHKDGWALVLPHADEPIYHIYSEGSDYETAEELTNIYKEKIKKILNS